MLTVVITTYNRSDVVLHAISSALEAFAGLSRFEIIVVDDASCDDTISVLERTYVGEIQRETLRLVRNKANLGVTGSKNAGYAAARNGWVMFLDSDDEILEGVGRDVAAVLTAHAHQPIIFFRCVDEKGNFVGIKFSQDKTLDIKTYLEHTSYGEALTVINKAMVRELPYVEELRGYEGLGCARIIDRHGPALLSCLVVRLYNCSGDDRLSVSAGMFRRLSLLAKGHLMIVAQFWRKMRLSRSLGYLVKSLIYGMAGAGYKLVKVARR